MSLLEVLKSYFKEQGFDWWIIAEQSVEVPAELSPPIGPNQKGIFLLLSVPARRLCVDPLVLSPRNSLLLKLTGIGDAFLSRRGVGKFQVVSSPFILDMACPAPNPPPDGIEKFSSKLPPTPTPPLTTPPLLGCLWEVHCRSALCSGSYKLQGKFYHWSFYTWVLA